MNSHTLPFQNRTQNHSISTLATKSFAKPTKFRNSKQPESNSQAKNPRLQEKRGASRFGCSALFFFVVVFWGAPCATCVYWAAVARCTRGNLFVWGNLLCWRVWIVKFFEWFYFGKVFWIAFWIRFWDVLGKVGLKLCVFW